MERCKKVWFYSYDSNFSYLIFVSKTLDWWMCAEKFDYIFRFGKAATEEKTVQVSEVASLITSVTPFITKGFLSCHFAECTKDCKVKFFLWHFFLSNSGIKMKLLVFILRSLKRWAWDKVDVKLANFPARWILLVTMLLRRHVLSQLRALTNCTIGRDIWGAGSLSDKKKWHFSPKNNLM